MQMCVLLKISYVAVSAHKFAFQPVKQVKVGKSK